MKYWLKRCPKCSGDLREESNSFGSYISCVQCGYMLTYMQEVTLLATGTLEEPHFREEEPQHVQEGGHRMAPATKVSGRKAAQSKAKRHG